MYAIYRQLMYMESMMRSFLDNLELVKLSVEIPFKLGLNFTGSVCKGGPMRKLDTNKKVNVLLSK